MVYEPNGLSELILPQVHGAFNPSCVNVTKAIVAFNQAEPGTILSVLPPSFLLGYIGAAFNLSIPASTPLATSPWVQDAACLAACQV